MLTTADNNNNNNSATKRQTPLRRTIVPMAQLAKHKHSSSSPSLSRRASSTTPSYTRKKSSTPSPNSRNNSKARIRPSIITHQVNREDRSPINPAGSISPLKHLSKTPSPKFDQDPSSMELREARHVPFNIDNFSSTHSFKDSFLSFQDAEIEEDITIFQSTSLADSLKSNLSEKCRRSAEQVYDACSVYSPEKESMGQVPDGTSPSYHRHRPTQLKLMEESFKSPSSPSSMSAWDGSQKQELMAYFSEQNLDHLFKQRGLLWSQLSEIRRREEQLYCELRHIDERIGGALQNRTRAKIW